ncbi:MAG: putative RiPP precursor [Rhizobiaceae bacterium]|nr:putative RiPP precursor [Rhizobiaceae bacterium]
MKKAYNKPTLGKREKLSLVTASNGSPTPDR